ncbi:MAG: GNAT family N-acetyltransferase [Bacteroidetes bacterium]|nr:MAG: GNAT family N-acetyltransferase [Bacteroidota bacterium]
MKDITFALATFENLEAISLLADKIWKNHYTSIISDAQIEYMLKKMYAQEALSAQMTTQNHIFYLAYLDKTLIGYASISTSDGKQYFLHKLYVDTNIHKKGIGTKFLEFLENKYSPETISLTVNRQNYKAINFYFKYGFTIQKVENFDIGNGFEMNDFIMIKNNLS